MSPNTLCTNDGSYFTQAHVLMWVALLFVFVLGWSSQRLLRVCQRMPGLFHLVRLARRQRDQAARERDVCRRALEEARFDVEFLRQAVRASAVPAGLAAELKARGLG